VAKTAAILGSFWSVFFQHGFGEERGVDEKMVYEYAL
jgi:hypothetical protein